MRTEFQKIDLRTKKQESTKPTEPVPIVDNTQIPLISSVLQSIALQAVDNKSEEVPIPPVEEKKEEIESLTIPKNEIEEIKTEIVIPEQKSVVKENTQLLEKELKGIQIFTPITVSKSSAGFKWRWVIYKCDNAGNDFNWNNQLMAHVDTCISD